MEISDYEDDEYDYDYEYEEEHSSMVCASSPPFFFLL
jgi:hypothetical protein